MVHNVGVAGDDSRARPPRDFLVEGDWPNGLVREHHGAQVAQQIAGRLAQVMTERGLSAKRLGADSGVNRRTIAHLLAGGVWADMLTIANLERALQVQLWPRSFPAGGQLESQK